MTEEEFLKGMGVLTAAFPDYELKPETAATYLEYLGYLSAQDWERAVSQHICSSKFFPKISELLAVIQPAAEEAWAKVLKLAEDAEEEPDGLDEPTRRAIQAIGGWEKFAFTDFDELKFIFKTFKEVYLLAHKQEQTKLALSLEKQGLLE